MNKVVSILESHPMFNKISHKHLSMLGEKSKIIKIDSGDCIYKTGDKSLHFYIVIKGVYEALDSRENKRWKKSEFLKAGDVFGDGGILEESTRYRSVLCNDSGELIQIPDSAFLEVIQEAERLTTVLDRTNKSKNLQFNEAHGIFEKSTQRITTFLDVARHPSTQKVIRHICRTLNLETQQPVLLIQLLERGGEVTLRELGNQSNSILAANTLPKNEHAMLAFIQLKIRLSEDDSGLPHLIRLLHLSKQHFPSIVIHVASQNYSKTVEECIRLSTISYVGINYKNIQHYHNCHFLNHLKSGIQSRIRVIQIINKNDPNPPRNEIESQLGLPIHGTLLTNPKSIPIPDIEFAEYEQKKRFTAQFRRIVREILGKRIGLVLSSGGAKGFAHIGVIQVLEENNIEVDCIAGSSMGSYIGACWAAGYNGKELEKLASEYKQRFSIFNLMTPSMRLRKGLLSTHKLAENLDKRLNGSHFRDLTIPLCVTATNIHSLENTFFTRGRVSAAVQASCSLPGICMPCEIDNETFIDGGVMDPLPIDFMEDLGIEKVISVSTVLTSEHNHINQLRLRRKQRNKNLLHKCSDFINTRINYFAHGNVFHTIMRSIEASQIRLVERDLLRSDVAIQPITSNNDWLKFNCPEKHIELGRESAEKHLHELKRLAA